MRMRKDQVFVRRRRAAGVGLAALLLGGTLTLSSCLQGDDTAGDAGSTSSSRSRTAQAPGPTGDGGSASSADDASSSSAGDAAAATSDAASALWQQPVAEARFASDTTALVKEDYLTGFGTPKSVVSSNHGLMIANNMMYSHSSTIFDAKTRKVIKKLPDSVRASKYGVEGHPGISKGSPVEAVWTADGRYAYVSNYTMYGENWGKEGFDVCSNTDGVGASTVYRFDAEEMTWDQVIKVGAVPKYMELSPDQKTLLVSNWCDWTVSLVDTATAKETATIPVGRNPRGIVVMPDGRSALVTAMWNRQVWRLDLEKKTGKVVMETPEGPRHLALTKDGKTAYLVVARANLVYKLDPTTMKILGQVTPGAEPRSMTMSPDEKALYVVNYDESTVSKIRTSDMTVIDKQPVDADPIGIDYDPVTNTVWVACYNGSMFVFDDQRTELADAA